MKFSFGFLFGEKKEKTSIENDISLNEKKSKISPIILKIYDEIKKTNKNVKILSEDIKEVRNSVSFLESKMENIEKYTLKENFIEISQSSNTNQSISKSGNEDEHKITAKPKKIIIKSENKKKELLPNFQSEPDLKIKISQLENLKSEILLAGDIPLKEIKNSTNSLVNILNWLEYLVNRLGIEQTKNILQNYAQLERWITYEVYFDLEKFLEGMKDIEQRKKNKHSQIDDVVSLYFIGKLNEKIFDDNITSTINNIMKA